MAESLTESVSMTENISSTDVIMTEADDPTSTSYGWWLIWLLVGLIVLGLVIWLIVWLVYPRSQVKIISVITPIAPPTNVTATVNGADTVSLSWTAPAVIPDRYRVYYGVGSTFVPVQGIGISGSATSYVLTIPNPSSDTYYVVMQSIYMGSSSHYSNISNGFRFDGSTMGPSVGTSIVSEADTSLYMTNSSKCLVVKTNLGLITPDFEFKFNSDGTITQVSTGYQIYYDSCKDKVMIGTPTSSVISNGDNEWTYNSETKQILFNNDCDKCLVLSTAEDGSSVILGVSGVNMISDSRSSSKRGRSINRSRCSSSSPKRKCEEDSESSTGCDTIDSYTQWNVKV